MSKMYSAREAGEKMGIPHKEVIRRIRRKEIEAGRIGWVYAISEEAVDKAMQSDWYLRNYANTR